MKLLTIKAMMALMLLTLPLAQVSAQGFLGKLSKAVNSLSPKAAKTDTKASLTDSADDDDDDLDSTEADSDSTSIDWDDIPIYHLQVINETNEDGSPALNADGTAKTRVLLVDQFGNYRSQEAVETQRKALKKYCTRIIAKVGGGAAVGAVVGLLSGGKKHKVAGAAIGAGAGAVVTSNVLEP